MELNTTENNQIINEGKENLADTSNANTENITQSQQSDNNVSVETKPNKEVDRTFTQKDLDDIVSKRIRKLYERYGVKNQDELDTLIGKAQQRDTFKDKNDNLLKENKELNERLLFISNGVKKEKYDDIRAYFKGKEIDFNKDTFLKELETHPEWLKNVKKVESIGNEKNSNSYEQDEREVAKKLFNLKGFVE